MAGPLTPLIGLIMIGRTVFTVMKSKAGQKLAKEAVDKFGAKVIQSTTKKNPTTLTRQTLNERTPTTLERVVTFGKVKKTSPGRNAPKEGITVGADRITAASRAKKAKIGLGAAGGFGTGLTIKQYVTPKKDSKGKTTKTGPGFNKTKKSKPPKKSYSQATSEAVPYTLKNSTHTIKKGDTYSSIAKKFGTTVSKLRELNKYADKKLPIGGKIKLK